MSLMPAGSGGTDGAVARLNWQTNNSGFESHIGHSSPGSPSGARPKLDAEGSSVGRKPPTCRTEAFRVLSRLNSARLLTWISPPFYRSLVQRISPVLLTA